jgi:hypothetical protein
MADKEFVRDEASQALINSDVSGFEQYKMNRVRAQKTRSLEQRVVELENLVTILMKDYNARSK